MKDKRKYDNSLYMKLCIYIIFSNVPLTSIPKKKKNLLLFNTTGILWSSMSSSELKC